MLCSTLEPRKNHLLILAVWRALVARLGPEAPKLLLVGTRGWHYDPIIDLVERSPALRSHVMEVSGLSTPGIKRLLDNARALLMPTFGEGYGLPVHEALAAGTPVIASDIPVFRWLTSPILTRLSPLDGEAWLETIADLSRTPRASGEPAAADRLRRRPGRPISGGSTTFSTRSETSARETRAGSPRSRCARDRAARGCRPACAARRSP